MSDLGALSFPVNKPPYIPPASKDWNAINQSRSPRSISRTYLTPEVAAAAPIGTVWKLGYDDFNVGRFTFTKKASVPGRDGEVRIDGLMDYGPGEDKVLAEIYQLGDVMCRGSGGERLYMRRGR